MLKLIFRAGWAHRHEVALATVVSLPLPAATRRAQRMLASALRDDLVLRRTLRTGECLYGLTAAGARWLRKHEGIDAKSTAVSLAEASEGRVRHRRIAAQIAISAEHLGCNAMHERELYQRGEYFWQRYQKLPDVYVDWVEDGITWASWHEVDLSHRNKEDIEKLHSALRALALTQGRLPGKDARLYAFVFHVKSGAAARQVRCELAKLWAAEGWEGADLENGNLTCRGFTVLIEPLPPIDYWPVTRDGLLLPWRGPSSLTQLPYQEDWEAAYIRDRSPLAALRAAPRTDQAMVE